VTKPTDPDDWLRQGEPGTKADPGEDWESAFASALQDEDLEPAPGNCEPELFQFSPGKANPYQFTPPDEDDLAEIPDLDEETAPTSTRPVPFAATGPDSEPTTPAAEPPVHRSFSLPGIAAGLCLLAGILALAILLLNSTPVFLRSGGVDEAQDPGQDLLPIAGGQNESKCRQWDFAPFFVPVAATDEAGARPFFLEVELAMLLVLAPDEEIPRERKILIRDLIYQFYRQQPLAMLRRYELARGEMSRDLLAWLSEHLPEAPVENIIFNRFQLLF
jgi:hypothetical protein